MNPFKYLLEEIRANNAKEDREHRIALRKYAKYIREKKKFLLNKKDFSFNDYCLKLTPENTIDRGKIVKERVEGMKYLYKQSICPLCNGKLKQEETHTYDAYNTPYIREYAVFCMNIDCSFFITSCASKEIWIREELRHVIG